MWPARATTQYLDPKAYSVWAHSIIIFQSSVSLSLAHFFHINSDRIIYILILMNRAIAGKYNWDEVHKSGFDKYRKYGDIVKETIVPGVDVIWLFDPNDIAKVLNNAGPDMYPQRKSHLGLEKYRKDRPHIYRTGGLLPTWVFAETAGNWWKLIRKFGFFFLQKWKWMVASTFGIPKRLEFTASHSEISIRFGWHNEGICDAHSINECNFRRCTRYFTRIVAIEFRTWVKSNVGQSIDLINLSPFQWFAIWHSMLEWKVSRKRSDNPTPHQTDWFRLPKIQIAACCHWIRDCRYGVTSKHRSIGNSACHKNISKGTYLPSCIKGILNLLEIVMWVDPIFHQCRHWFCHTKDILFRWTCHGLNGRETIDGPIAARRLFAKSKIGFTRCRGNGMRFIVGRCRHGELNYDSHRLISIDKISFSISTDNVFDMLSTLPYRPASRSPSKSVCRSNGCHPKLRNGRNYRWQNE